MVSIQSAITSGVILLKENDIATPRLDCEVLLAHVLNCSRLMLITGMQIELNEVQYNEFLRLVKRRAEGCPVAYLVGRKEFMGLDFNVRPGVLIPRGDTETVTERAIDECKRYSSMVEVADVCCGSGAIGISIAKFVPNAYVTMTDISDTAVGTASENVSLNEVFNRVCVKQGDLLTHIMDMKFNIIVSNPPYIETEIIETLERDVKEFEPRIALDGGVDGLKYYRSIATQAQKCLKTGGALIFEIGYDQACSVSGILEDNGFEGIEVLKDLGGLDRCVMGRRP